MLVCNHPYDMPRTRDVLTMTLPHELTAWLDKMVETRVFANRSHGVELCILEGQKKYGR